jgi:SAM-dependent methyltransferase
LHVADLYPSAEILGNDISPIQPSVVPPNVKFEVDDVEAEWVYSSKFDFIHCRYMIGSIRDWPRLIQQAFQFTKPGGWVEFTDYDAVFYTSTNGNWKEGEPIDVWSKKLAEGMNAFGMEANPGPRLEGWIRTAGFESVELRVLPFPVGTWPKDRKMKEIGAFNLLHFLEGLEPISLRCFMSGLGWSQEEVQVFLAQCRNEFKKKDKRIQHNLYVVWARKPMNAQ